MKSLPIKKKKTRHKLDEMSDAMIKNTGIKHWSVPRGCVNEAGASSFLEKPSNT